MHRVRSRVRARAPHMSVFASRSARVKGDESDFCSTSQLSLRQGRRRRGPRARARAGELGRVAAGGGWVGRAAPRTAGAPFAFVDGENALARGVRGGDNGLHVHVERQRQVQRLRHDVGLLLPGLRRAAGVTGAHGGPEADDATHGFTRRESGEDLTGEPPLSVAAPGLGRPRVRRRPSWKPRTVHIDNGRGGRSGLAHSNLTGSRTVARSPPPTRSPPPSSPPWPPPAAPAPARAGVQLPFPPPSARTSPRRLCASRARLAVSIAPAR